MFPFFFLINIKSLFIYCKIEKLGCFGEIGGELNLTWFDFWGG